MTPTAEQAILADFECEDWDTLIETNQCMLNDSVQCCYCTPCGEYWGEGEPDLRQVRCENCGAIAVESLTEIILGNII